MTIKVPDQDLPLAVLPSLSLKQTRTVRKAGKPTRNRRNRSLCQDLPLREGVGSLERWLDLNA